MGQKNKKVIHSLTPTHARTHTRTQSPPAVVVCFLERQTMNNWISYQKRDNRAHTGNIRMILFAVHLASRCQWESVTDAGSVFSHSTRFVAVTKAC